MAQHRATRRPPRAGTAGPSRRFAAVLVLALVLVTAGTTWFTGAAFTATSDTHATVTASADYYPPTVSLASPGTTVHGTVQLAATAGDSASGVTQVVFQVAPGGSSTWTTLCTDTTAPYSCSWDTTTMADGDVQLRATATDAAGFNTTSVLVTTRISNAAAVVLKAIPTVVRGAVPLSAEVTGANGRPVSTTFFYVDDTGKQTAITGCQSLTGTAPSCTWDTGTLVDVYDVKVVSTLGTGTTTVVQAVQRNVTVDNAAPLVTVDAPSPMSGTVQVVATASDEDSGIATVELQYRQVGSTTWVSLCTRTADPYRCALDTTRLVNETEYELRAIATDVAGNSTTTTPIRRKVSNGTASVTITAPLSGEVLRGTGTLTVDTATPTGTSVTRVRYERRPAGGTWADACVATVAPWSCAWDTTTGVSGSYELRATMTYGSGTNLVSPVVTVTVDNNPLRALDVQATDGGTLGRAGAGDTLVLTYSAAVDLKTIKAGWTGGSTALTVTLRDKAVNPASTSDRVTFDVALGQVAFAQDYIRNNRSVTIPATMAATTSPTGGTVITVTFGTPVSSSNELRTSSVAGTMRWTPAATVRDLNGALGSTTTAVESGAADADL